MSDKWQFEIVREEERRREELRQRGEDARQRALSGSSIPAIYEPDGVVHSYEGGMESGLVFDAALSKEERYDKIKAAWTRYRKGEIDTAAVLIDLNLLIR